jgi:hypothetical protein
MRLIMLYRRSTLARLALAVLAAPALLASCGGGIWIGYDGNDQPPQVSLATVATAQVGENIRLAAAASDDGYIDYVAFYRVDDNGQSVRLGDDGSAPYDWVTPMPSSSTGSVRFFARAFDNDGHWADSDEVSVAIAP